MFLVTTTCTSIYGQEFRASVPRLVCGLHKCWGWDTPPVCIYIKLTKTWRDSLTGMQVYLECVLENVRVICNSSLQATNYYDKGQYSVIRRPNSTRNLFVLNCFCIMEVWFFFIRSVHNIQLLVWEEIAQLHCSHRNLWSNKYSNDLQVSIYSVYVVVAFVENT